MTLITAFYPYRATTGLSPNFLESKILKFNYQSDEELSEVDLDDVLSDFSVRTRNRGVDYKFSAT